MPKSMTGYAKLQALLDEYKISCEIKTLNSKGLSVDVSLPYFLNSKELDVIALVKKYISRGKVNVRLYVKFLRPVQISFDFSMVRTYFEILNEVRENLSIPSTVDLSHLLNFRDAFQFEFSSEDIEHAWASAKQVLEETLKQVVEERTKEGKKLTEDLKAMTNRMKQIVSLIAEKADEVPRYIADRLRKNVREILPDDVELNRELFENAVAIIADRADIREELVRLKSHLSRTDELLESDQPIGDLLNFISQEISREFNTILSKSRLLEISNLALEGKYIASQFKEQIANIE